MQPGAYIKIELMCQTCGEHFEAEAPVVEDAALFECPACGSRDVEVEERADGSPKPGSLYDRGMCPCVILAQSGAPRHRR